MCGKLLRNVDELFSPDLRASHIVIVCGGSALEQLLFILEVFD